MKKMTFLLFLTLCLSSIVSAVTLIDNFADGVQNTALWNLSGWRSDSSWPGGFNRAYEGTGFLETDAGDTANMGGSTSSIIFSKSIPMFYNDTKLWINFNLTVTGASTAMMEMGIVNSSTCEYHLGYMECYNNYLRSIYTATQTLGTITNQNWYYYFNSSNSTLYLYNGSNLKGALNLVGYNTFYLTWHSYADTTGALGYSNFTMMNISTDLALVNYVINNSLNFTSDGGQICGYNSSISSYTTCGPTEDGTPTFNFKTPISMSCKLWNESGSWATLNNISVPDCSTTGDTNHVCTFPFALQNGTKTLYISCKAGTSEYYYNGGVDPSLVFNISIISPIRNSQNTADDAIVYGISKSAIWPGAIIYSAQPVYIRSKNNSQAFATFDKVAVYGNQRWAFNYIIWNTTYTKPSVNANAAFFNISPVFYFWEGVNLSYWDTTNQVTTLINSTKN